MPPAIVDDRPKYSALFVRNKFGTQLPDWLLHFQDEIVGVLSQDLDITVIDEDFDYGEICDKHNPDFVIFDSPGCHRSVPLTIKNSSARPDIPRIGFFNQDPHDTSRVMYLRMMDELKIERFFSIWGAATMRQSPELMGRVFIAPLYFDGEMFKDYGLEKNIPVSVFGWGVGPDFYAWRAAVVPQIINYFPTLVYTHPGYGETTERYRFPINGVDYAKMLNRSHFSLTDTTRLDYLVRKHLEIPACGAVLVTPATADVFYYGFRDMENCIMGSGIELFQKIASVANDPNLYETIRKNGQNLVRDRFVREKWHFIRDWFECHRSLRPGETVQQQGVFGSFVAVSGGEEKPAVACEPLQDSEFSLNMKTAWQKILVGESLDEAEAMLNGMLTWLGHLAEPYMLLGVIALLRGHPTKAKEHFLRPFQIRHVRERGNTCLDPEEIAWLSMTGVLMVDREFTQQMRSAGVGVRYLGLRRMEWLFEKQGNFDSKPPTDVVARKSDDRLTIHWTGQLDINSWVALMKRIMTANR
ncbi:MAG: glycosyltransferase [Bdellovibrionales bacterium]|jgi:hypothetical protein